MAEAKEIRAEVKDKTGPLDSFLKSVGIGSGLCIGICIGIVVLIFIIAFLAGLGSNPDKDNVTVQNNGVQGQTNTQGNTAATKNEFEADGLSKSITISGVTVRVLNAYSVPADKKDKYYFEISSENNSNEDVYTPSNSSFQIEDTEKYVTDSQIGFGLDNSYPYFQKLSQNQKVKGVVYFELNKGEIPQTLVLKQWNLFGDDKVLRWKIASSDVKAIACMTDYDCSNSIYQQCIETQCKWKEGNCGTDADCSDGKRCLYNTCSSSVFG